MPGREKFTIQADENGQQVAALHHPFTMDLVSRSAPQRARPRGASAPSRHAALGQWVSEGAIPGASAWHRPRRRWPTSTAAAVAGRLMCGCGGSTPVRGLAACMMMIDHGDLQSCLTFICACRIRPTICMASPSPTPPTAPSVAWCQMPPKDRTRRPAPAARGGPAAARLQCCLALRCPCDCCRWSSEGRAMLSKHVAEREC